MPTRVSPLLLRYQGPMLKALGEVAVSALRGPQSSTIPATPGPMVTATVPPRPNALIDAYLRWCGAPPDRHRETVPPHLFPQWGFPLLGQTLAQLPFKLTGVLNQGCRVQVHGEIPRGRTLSLQGRLESIEEDERKVRIHQRLWTGLSENDVRLTSDVFSVVVKPRRDGGGKKRKSASREEPQLTELGRWHADLHDGRRFGVLTGDLNPIHISKLYAKAAGFPRQILHGFGSYARSYETLRNAWPDVEINDFEVRFTRPLVLPAACRVLATTDGDTREVRLLDGKDRVCMAGQLRLASG